MAADRNECGMQDSFRSGFQICSVAIVCSAIGPAGGPSGSPSPSVRVQAGCKWLQLSWMSFPVGDRITDPGMLLCTAEARPDQQRFCLPVLKYRPCGKTAKSTSSPGPAVALQLAHQAFGEPSLYIGLATRLACWAKTWPMLRVRAVVAIAFRSSGAVRDFV